MPEAEANAKFMTQIGPGMFQGVQRLPLLPLLATDGHADAGVAPIRADLDVGYFHLQEPGIIQFEGNQFRQFFANCFGYAQCAAFVHIDQGREPGAGSRGWLQPFDRRIGQFATEEGGGFVLGGA
jgi:hypothetical protein